jgi:hypothetical protein
MSTSAWLLNTGTCCSLMRHCIVVALLHSQVLNEMEKSLRQYQAQHIAAIASSRQQQQQLASTLSTTASVQQQEAQVRVLLLQACARHTHWNSICCSFTRQHSCSGVCTTVGYLFYDCVPCMQQAAVVFAV